MREPYGKAVATRAGPEPWRGVREDAPQASAGVRAGWVWSRERTYIGAPTPWTDAEGNTGHIAIARYGRASRGRRPHARIETSCAEAGRSRCWPWPVVKARVVKN